MSIRASGGGGSAGTIACMHISICEVYTWYGSPCNVMLTCPLWPRFLVNHLIAHARSLGVSSVSLTTPTANQPGIAFYQKMGFRLRRTFPVPSEHVAGFEISELAIAL